MRVMLHRILGQDSSRLRASREHISSIGPPRASCSMIFTRRASAARACGETLLKPKAPQANPPKARPAPVSQANGNIVGGPLNTHSDEHSQNQSGMPPEINLL